jgi:uncharacterized membrane protein YgcG
MLKHSKRFLQLSAIMLLVGLTASAQIAVPQPQGLVNDFANKLKPAARKALESRLQDFSDSHGIEIAVVTIPFDDLKNNPIDKYTRELAQFWKNSLGHTKLEAVLLIAIQSKKTVAGFHGSTRLEVSRRLEEDLPDELAGEIIREMRPELKAGRFNEALNKGVEGIFSALEQTYLAAPDAGGYQGYSANSNSAGSASATGSNQTFKPQTDSFSRTSLLLLFGLPLLLTAAILLLIGRTIVNSNNSPRQHRGEPTSGRTFFNPNEANHQPFNQGSSWHETNHFSQFSTSSSGSSHSSYSDSGHSDSGYSDSSSYGSSDSGSSGNSDSSSSGSSDSSSSSSGGSTDSW